MDGRVSLVANKRPVTVFPSTNLFSSHADAFQAHEASLRRQVQTADYLEYRITKRGWWWLVIVQIEVNDLVDNGPNLRNKFCQENNFRYAYGVLSASLQKSAIVSGERLQAATGSSGSVLSRCSITLCPGILRHSPESNEE